MVVSSFVSRFCNKIEFTGKKENESRKTSYDLTFSASLVSMVSWPSCLASVVSGLGFGGPCLAMYCGLRSRLLCELA